jgi:MFS family permease
VLAYFRTLRRSLDPQLPGPVWLLQLGGLMNFFGNGIVFPFLVIYLHDVRGFSLTTAGLVIAASSAAQLVAGVSSGPAIDRLGPRRLLACGLVLQAVGFGLFPLVREPWQAFLLITIEGAGSAFFWPSQSTLMSRLVDDRRRHHAFAVQRATMNLGIGLGGLVGGLIAVADDPGSFTVLFVVDALTFLAYIVALAFVPDPGVPHDEAAVPATYGAVLKHKTFLGLWVLNFTFVAAGISLLNLVPPFAHDQAGITERQIGIFFLVNTLVIVVVQLPIARWLEGKRRLRAIAIMPLLFAVAWLVVDASGFWFEATAAFALLLVAALILGVAECFHGPAHIALVADVGPVHLRGRYFAVHSLSWGLAGAVGPAVGGLLLDHAPFALWPLAGAALCVAAGGWFTLQQFLPERLQRVPRSEIEAVAVDEGAQEDVLAREPGIQSRT